MKWTIPGTVLQIPQENAEHIEDIFAPMFFGGGIALSQVVAVTGLESHTVQNWVKRGFLPPPEKKRYSQRQLCRILNIHMLKSVLPLEQICILLGYINGHLDDVRDDTNDYSQLYFMFVRLAARAKELYDQQERDALLASVLSSYQEPVPGAKARVEEVLRIMLTAWLAARMRQQTEVLMATITNKEC